jgi:hypothetical protein
MSPVHRDVVSSGRGIVPALIDMSRDPSPYRRSWAYRALVYFVDVDSAAAARVVQGFDDERGIGGSPAWDKNSMQSSINDMGRRLKVLAKPLFARYLAGKREINTDFLSPILPVAPAELFQVDTSTEVELTLSSPQHIFESSETISVLLGLRNLTDRPLKLINPDNFVGHPFRSLDLIVFQYPGWLLRRTQVVQEKPSGLGSRTALTNVLLPGATIQVTLSLQREATTYWSFQIDHQGFNPPGHYSIRARFHPMPGRQGAFMVMQSTTASENPWWGDAYSNELDLIVKPADGQTMPSEVLPPLPEPRTGGHALQRKRSNKRRELARPEIRSKLVFHKISVTSGNAGRAELRDESLRKAFVEAYKAKFANPAYIKLLKQKGFPDGYQDFPEERGIKYARAAIARALAPPEGIKPIVIPMLKGQAPMIDGVIEVGEWSEAAAINVGGTDYKTTLLLSSDGKRLFLACDVPDEPIAESYDQFRFYFHVNVIPELANERMHIAPYMVSAIRETAIPRSMALPEEPEPVRNYSINDSNIFRTLAGATQVRQHRQYEAVIDLSEVGLEPGIPFPARVEVERGPQLDANGKFVERRYVGSIGIDNDPIWFVVAKPKGVGPLKRAHGK